MGHHRRYLLSIGAGIVASLSGCFSGEHEQLPILDFVVFNNMDSTRTYEIEFEVMKDDTVTFESSFTLGRAPEVDFEFGETENESEEMDNDDERELMRSQRLLDEGWPQSPGEYVSNARIEGGNWSSVDVSEEASERYLGIQYITRNNSISAPFLQRYNSPEDSVYRER